MLHKLAHKIMPILLSVCMVLGLGGSLYAANTLGATHSTIGLSPSLSPGSSSSGTSSGPRVVTDTTTQVSCDVSALTLPKGATQAWLSDRVVTESSINDAVAALAQNIGSVHYNVVKMYQLKILNESGIEFTDYSGLVKVRFPIPKGASGKLRVYRYDKDALTDMAAVKDGDYLQFFVHTVGYFAIVQSDGLAGSGNTNSKTGSDTEAPSIPETGAPSLPMLPLAIAGICFIIGVVFFSRRRKRS